MKFSTIKCRRHLFHLALLALLILPLETLAWAGAWCQKQGSLYSKLSYNHYFTVYTFDKDGHARRNVDGSNFRDNNVTWYLEYGLFDHLTAFSSLPYKWLKSRYESSGGGTLQHVTRRYDGLGDLELGLKYCFLEAPLVLSSQFLMKVPWFYSSHESVPPGNHQNDYELRFLAGKSLWPFPGYCGLEFGYRRRTAAPADEFRYLVEFGMNLPKKFSARIKLDGTESANNADVEPATSASVLFNPSLGLQYDLAKLEFTLGYQCTKRWSAEVTYTNNPYGKNIAQGDQLSFGLVYYFSCQ
jgi:protein XagA